MVIALDNTLQVWKARAAVALQYVFASVLCGAVMFVLVSANFAWAGRSFDLSIALWAAGAGAVFSAYMLCIQKRPIDMSLRFSKSKKLIQKEARLAQSRAELQDEAEQMKTLHRLENED
ncbi:MAG: hypothetical protein COB69_04065 [Phycisphaera sp.]|nr:MAG: hypothetical protein COB69_04065 [Phycisphaera sp.]